MLPLATAFPSFADEFAAPATDAAAVAAPSVPTGVFGMTATELAIAFLPLGVYGLFSLYRAKVNPRAKVRYAGNMAQVE
jgi:hypothetical protein